MSDGLPLSNDHLANEITNCLEDIYSSTAKITHSHKALLETNLAVIAYIEESKQRLEKLRLKRARKASSLKEVVKILSE
ncbi:hypothetical protein K1T71_011733 [Dendrolimus kikuchii]|uniref:Uncharacterized protein n=1 Tax=Dendrolimus kikuchii TaxID=765133 RepID=A0ACC1CLV9_9NEOP|nr:hypothetical protein K1T71_011733 [Dendrolimus kikuchii]